MIRLLRERFFGPDRDRDPRLVFGMEVDGHRLWTYRTVDHMPVIRETIVRVGYAKMEMGVRPEDARAMCSILMEELDRGNLSRAAQTVGYFEQQLENFGSERVALEIGGYGVLVDDEPHNETTDHHNKIKENLCRLHPHVRLFFLNASARYLQGLNASIEASLLMGQLTNPRRAESERLFLRAIRTELCAGLWSVLTPPPSGWQRRLAAILRATS